MCGRAYLTYTDEELAIRYLGGRRFQLGALKPSCPSYNVAPTQLVPVVFREGEERQIRLFRWGLILSWAKDEKIGYSTINARSETLAEKPAFREAFRKRRCVIPLSGFFEWKREGEKKRPFAIHLKEDAIMSVAGIWECWKSKEGSELHTFSIVTTEANALMAAIHDRMPVILGRHDEDAWLSGGQDTAPLKALLKPCPSEWLVAYEVSTEVNNPRNNRPELLQAVY